MNEPARDILLLQRNGDYEGMAERPAKKGVTGASLREGLNRLAENNIPAYITF